LQKFLCLISAECGQVGAQNEIGRDKSVAMLFIRSAPQNLFAPIHWFRMAWQLLNLAYICR